jgi:flagellar hook-basal body complex protein FliE
MPIDPAFSVTGPDWSIPPVEAPTGPDAAIDAPAEGSGGFGTALSNAMGSLTRSQEEAAGAAQALASGAATDPTAVVMAVERAQLTMQLATQIRTKAVESIQDIFHTQV